MRYAVITAFSPKYDLVQNKIRNKILSGILDRLDMKYDIIYGKWDGNIEQSFRVYRPKHVKPSRFYKFVQTMLKKFGQEASIVNIDGVSITSYRK